MIKEPKIPLFDLIACLSDTADLVDPIVANHHKQVAYIALSIGAELAIPLEEQNKLVLAGALHDIGALSFRERMDALRFEIETPFRHAELGYSLLKTFSPLSDVASLVRFHHIPWNEGSGAEFNGEQVPVGSHILHLAGRISVLIDKRKEILGQVKEVCERVAHHSGNMFMPHLVEAFLSLATKEFFWLDAASRSIGSILSRRVRLPTIDLNGEALLGLARLFSQVIDFRSPFTATHSSGVAASAEALARFAGFSERECRMMRVAGYLHDLGKLALPAEILHKPATLEPDEFNLIKAHTFYTYRILETIGDLDTINTWASFHHERLDGTGYPFHLKGEELSLGSRIMAVADVFTAITENRPYRQGMSMASTVRVLEQMAGDSALDAALVSTLRLHYDEVNSVRMAAQAAAAQEYREFREPPLP